MKPEPTSDQNLFNDISALIEEARKRVATAVNLAMVHTYFEIGKRIVEHEQHGKHRAEYGKSVLKSLSKRLSVQFGNGFSVVNLQQMRTFYETYSNQQTLSANLENPNFQLSWSHYLVLMRIAQPEARQFYEIEAIANQWGLRELKRQVDSALYERLALSQNPETVKQLAAKGQIITKAQDVIKDPYVLEFLSLPAHTSYSESQFEANIMDHLQLFLLELGKGFLFEARQKRFTFDEEHFFVDLVFYNRLLQCYVLIDLKVGKLKHQDLGQMQMYVNYFDRHVKLPDEKPTIGILLCQHKNDALVELTLPQDANIYASAYQMYLPDKTLLQQKLNEWTQNFEQQS